MGKALAITPDNGVGFVSVPYGRRMDWAGFESVLAAGPTLVHKSAIAVDPRSEGFTDPHVLGEASRAAVGLTARSKLLLVATDRCISLWKLAKAMRALGCTEAINLDGGSSTALYYRGRWLVTPRRKLVNLLAVFEGVPPSRRRAALPTGEGPSAMARWQGEQAWELFEQAQKLGAGEQKLDLLARACELDSTNASYCLELARVFEETGDYLGAATAYARASERYRCKGMVTEALPAAQRAVRLAPQQAHVVMELGRAARMAGLAELARDALERGRALFLLGALPESRPETLSTVVNAIRSVTKGPQPPRYALAGTLSERTLSADRLGLYIRLPEEWQWLPLARATAAVAYRRYMPWLVHIAVAGVPAQADLELIRHEYLRNTMLFTEPPKPTRLGRVAALRFTARAMAGDEPARYDIIFAKQDTLLVIVTMATHERWWAQASEEFSEVLQGTAFVHPSNMEGSKR
jgi:tetratricopeptide (TPR) repeat protein